MGEVLLAKKKSKRNNFIERLSGYWVAFSFPSMFKDLCIKKEGFQNDYPLPLYHILLYHYITGNNS